MRSLRRCVTIVVVLAAVPAYGFDLLRLEITTSKGAYDVDMAFTVDAPPARIIAALTDYDSPNRLNPDVEAMHVVAQEGDVTRVRTEFRACALVFCRDLAMLQDVSVSDSHIVADIVPTAGQFSAGRYDWHITRTTDDTSLVEFRATVKYEFFVMPVIGRAILRNQLRKQLLLTVANLETAASR